MTAMICLIIGIVFLLYFTVISIYTRHAYSRLELCWLVMALVLISAGILLLFDDGSGSYLFVCVRWFLLIAAAAVLLIICRPLYGVLRTMNAHPVEKLPYVIVLGAHIFENRPTRSLKRRLDEAFAYAQRNPDTLLILSGGQGSDEIMTEASCMKEYLMEKGLMQSRMILEEKSTTTYENLLFSDRMTGCKDMPTGILSNSFHVFRAVSLAKKQGYRYAYPIPASSDPLLQTHYIFREILAWWQGKIKGIL